MIWIQSDDTDLSTNMVIDWLDHFKADWLRTNYLNSSISLQKKNDKFEILFENIHSNKRDKFYLSEVLSYWYRRGEIFIFNPNSYEKNTPKTVRNYLEEESKVLTNYIYSELKNIPHINNFNDNNINKLFQLNCAQNVGLSIPKTFITSDKNELIQLIDKYEEMICKSLSVSGIRLEEGYQGWGTQLIDKNVLNEILNLIENQFFITLLQLHIKKIFEVRAFFLVDKIWSSCIMSQNDEQTKIDFRNYNNKRPNHTPPFKLPDEVETKIFKFAKKLGINSGSVDLIYGQDNEYYFLEINPIGQFWQVSNPCNYNLEKEIALKLMQYEKP